MGCQGGRGEEGVEVFFWSHLLLIGRSFGRMIGENWYEGERGVCTHAHSSFCLLMSLSEKGVGMLKKRVAGGKRGFLIV